MRTLHVRLAVKTPAGKLVIPNAGVMNIDKNVFVAVILVPAGPPAPPPTIPVVNSGGYFVL